MQTLKVDMLFSQFSPKKRMKLKEFVLEGASEQPPLDPPMCVIQVLLFMRAC